MRRVSPPVSCTSPVPLRVVFAMSLLAVAAGLCHCQQADLTGAVLSGCRDLPAHGTAALLCYEDSCGP